MRYLTLFLLLFLTGQLQAQGFIAEQIKEQVLDADVFIGVDKFDNIFYTKNRTLYKSETRQTLEYAALNLGEITTVDIVNPFKISVFYKQSNTVVLLDNTLTEIIRIEFSNLEDFRNSAIARTANDRRLWIFNTDLQQLELFDYRLNSVIVQFPPQTSIPYAYVSNFNFCWIQEKDALRGYNIYGTLVEEIAIPFNFEKLVQSQNTLIGVKDNSFYIKQARDISFTSIDNLKITAQEFSLIGEILYIYNGQHLLTYSIKPANCLLYTSPSPRDKRQSRMPSSA